jgi:hypothetical protein
MDSNNSSTAARDYFAAHAPQEIPDWFQPPGEPVPAVAHRYFFLQADERWNALTTEAKRLHLDEHDEMGAEHVSDPVVREVIVSATARTAENHEAVKKANARNEAARYFAWRWHYADQMLAARQAAQQPAAEAA